MYPKNIFDFLRQMVEKWKTLTRFSALPFSGIKIAAFEDFNMTQYLSEQDLHFRSYLEVKWKSVHSYFMQLGSLYIVFDIGCGEMINTN